MSNVQCVGKHTDNSGKQTVKSAKFIGNKLPFYSTLYVYVTEPQKQSTS